MAFDIEDTIVAIASAAGSSLRGIVRLSGPSTVGIVQQILVPDSTSAGRLAKLNQQPFAATGHLTLSAQVNVPVLTLIWPTSKSYTRQPTAEFHLIGSAPVLANLQRQIIQAGARLARPGEFTLRAFLSGRIDLTQAEAVLAVIDANEATELRTALSQLSGGLAGPLGVVRNELIAILAELEAGLDFVEEDIEFISTAQLDQSLSSASQALQRIIFQIESRSVVRSRLKVVLFGLPNSGKSSLLNATTENDRAIVTDQSGTTTDFVTGLLHVDGTQVELVDTAGFEQPEAGLSPIESKSQDKREESQLAADYRVLCLDCSRAIAEWESQILQSQEADLVIVNKIDLAQSQIELERLLDEIQKLTPSISIIQTSCKSGLGIDSLKSQIVEWCRQTASEIDVVGSTIARASDSLAATLEAVQTAQKVNLNGLGEEIVAAEIRQALDELGRVVGTIYTDDILDHVFSKFCIGK